MNIEEFSNEFDTLINSYATSDGTGNQSDREDIELNEYEKSVFLTKSQEEYVKGIYDGTLRAGAGFEQTEKIRRSLDRLVLTASLVRKTLAGKALSDQSSFWTLPDDHLYTVYEQVKLSDDSCPSLQDIVVVPVGHDSLYNEMRNPFRYNDTRALRVNIDDDTVEVFCTKDISEYVIRYLSKPSPIILEDLPDGLTINGESSAMTCALDEAVHREILERAVQLALVSKSTINNSKV